VSTSPIARIGSWIAILACLIIPAAVRAEQPKMRATVGAYYFDGWSGKTEAMHLPKLLQTKYADRKPRWGWRADTVEIMQQQIDYCADHGIAFWAFGWYYPEGKDKTTPLNNALDLFLKAPNRQRMKFCLLVANHAGFRIRPKDWDACCEKWIERWRQPAVPKADRGQPADHRAVCSEDVAALRPGDHDWMGLSALGRREATTREDVCLVS
jgi:hypothetical protein